MSTEQILLLVVFILLPLAQYLFAAARQRQGGQPEQGDGQQSSARRPREPRSPANAPLPPLRTDPRLQERATEPVSDAMAVSERARTGEAAPPVAPATRGRRSARGRAAVADLRNPIGLRRAVVLMTILGPCRATSPHEWPERGGMR